MATLRAGVLLSAVCAMSCAGKLTYLSPALTTPVPPATLRQTSIEPQAADVTAPAKAKQPPSRPRTDRAARTPAPTPTAPPTADVANPNAAGTLGTSGSVSVVSVRPEDARGGSLAVTTSTTAVARKRTAIGAVLVLVIVAAAVYRLRSTYNEG